MCQRFIRFATLFVVTICTLAIANAQEKQSKVSFRRDIRPILSDKCFFCHGPDPKMREADLRLDLEASAKEDLGGYVAIQPGEPDESEMISRITSEDEDERMPPIDSGKSLTGKEIALIKQWIQQGAKWEKHWAYDQPGKWPLTPPKTSLPEWEINQVDKFVLAKLEQYGIKPAAEADRVTLVRRLYFDLIGLPPTPDQMDAFLENPSDQAYLKLVDELLASPHFGERMAIYWLDLVRYADTVGYHGDQDQNISAYRDWVIFAFNQNMPFDQFTREQLAGDLLAKPTQSQKIATGYNRLLQTSHEGGVQPKEYRTIYAADRVRNVSAVWMGATVGCAQCHDHKYDPYTTKDFYSLSAFFADVDDESHFSKGTNANPTARAPEIEVVTELQKIRLKRLQEKVAALSIKEQQAPALSEKEKKQLRSQIEQLYAQIEALRKSKSKTMITVALKTPRTVRVLPRGNWLDDSGEIVMPAIPGFLGKLGNDKQRLTRLDLANWLIDRDSEMAFLTSRVMANRFWYLMFGSGISADLGDFGGQGTPPTQPELLDYLAGRFIELDWDVKKLIREIVTSRTYRQASIASRAKREMDPENRWFARQGSYRLPAEMVRDNALLIGGLLVDELGGASVRPYQPAGYYRHLNFPPRKYQHHKDLRQWRRGVYVHWQRQFLHPTFKALDAPTREECTAQRPKSNTPLAALSLLNDPTFIESARAFAERIMKQGGDRDETRINFAFRWVTSRKISEDEQSILIDLLRASRLRFKDDLPAAKKLIATGLSKPDPELEARELAAWTSVCRALLNLNETITRN